MSANGKNLSSLILEESKIKEIWKDINGYEGFYQVSNLGRIKSLDRYICKSNGVIQFKKGKIKVPKLNSDGYNVIALSKNGRNKTIAIHILVAKHFIANPKNLPEVNHKDFNRTNNVVDNLEWLTHQENIKYSADHNRYKLKDVCGKNNPNYGNHILSEIYKNNPLLAKEKLSRPAGQNGRAVKIALYDNKMNYIKTFDWIGGCAKYLIENNYTTNKINSVNDRISDAMKNNKEYLNHYYKKLA